MARPKKPETMETVSVRLPRSMIEEIDRYTVKLEEETPLLAISRTDTIRYLILKALRGGDAKANRRRK